MRYFSVVILCLSFLFNANCTSEETGAYIDLLKKYECDDITIKNKFYFDHDRIDVILDLIKEYKEVGLLKAHSRSLTMLKVELRIMKLYVNDRIKTLNNDIERYRQFINDNGEVETIKRYLGFMKDSEDKLRAEEKVLNAINKIEEEFTLNQKCQK